MSEQPLDLRRSMQVVRRYKPMVILFALLGLVGGAAYTEVKPPLLTSQALVVLPASIHDSATQAVIARSNPVLSAALPHVDSVMSLQTLRGLVQVKSMTYNALGISAQGRTAAQAEDTANAVTNSYVNYVSSGNAPGGQVRAHVLETAASAMGTSLYVRMAEQAAAGALAGMLIGAIIALAISRGDRRLRTRDEIADSIGIPVLSSIPVRRPADAGGWARLLADYAARPVDAWHLRKTLQDLGLADVRHGTGASVTVISLSSDRKALALGPQIAAFAASLGLPTLLLVGPQRDVRATAALTTACAAPLPSARQSRRSKNLRAAVSDHDHAGRLPSAALSVVVAVVDNMDPRVNGAISTTATVLGVSAGAATAEQLARVAAAVAADGRHLAGILVADPDPADHTTGRLPQLARSAERRMPSRITGATTESRR